MKSRKRRIMRAGSTGSGGGLEVLETRVLMTAAPVLAGAVETASAMQVVHAAVASKYDLVPSFTAAPNLKGTLVAGQTITGTVDVAITNKGKAASPGAIQITAY